LNFRERYEEISKFPPPTKHYIHLIDDRINLMLQNTLKIVCIPQNSKNIYQFENNYNNNNNVPSKKQLSIIDSEFKILQIYGFN